MLRTTSGLGLVCGILALVVSLGVPSEAAKLINGKLLKNNSVAAKKLKNSTVDARAVSASSIAWGREVSVLVVPNGQGFTPPA
jgi:hypothetical protein